LTRRAPLTLLLWLLLMALALGAYAGGRGGWVGLAWGLAALKGMVVSERLMELHRAPRGWRAAGILWVAGCIGGILLLLP
jgi:hypothetical protein